MSDNTVQVKFGIQIAELLAGLSEASSAVKEHTETMKGSLEGLMKGVEFVGKSFAALAAIAGGGKMFAEAINATKEVTSNAKMMGKVLGVTTTDASIFNVALASVGGSSDQAKTALVMMTKTLGAAPEKFDQLGVATKDSGGQMRSMQDILLDTNEKFSHMTDGTAKNLAMAQIFGRKWMEVGPVLGLTAEALEEAQHHAEALNLVVGQENERDTKAFKISMTGMKEVMEGVQKTIGQAVMPLLTDLGDWFSSLGPAAVAVTQYSIGALMATLQGLKFVAIAVWEGLKTLIEGFGAGLAMMVDMAEKAIHGDWAGVKSAWKQGTDQIKDIASTNLAVVEKQADKTATAIKQLFSGQTATKMKHGEDAPEVGKVKSDKKDPSEVGEWERINKIEKEGFQLKNDLRERDLSADVVYWQSKLAHANVSNGDRLKVEEKIAAAQLALMKKNFNDGKALHEEDINATEKTALDGLALTKAKYDQDLALGKITQAQLIQLDLQQEAQKLAIQQAAQAQRVQMAADDPSQNAAALQKQKDKLLEIERAYTLAKTGILTKAAVEDAKYGKQFEDGMASGFSGVIKNFAQGTMTIQSLFLNMGKAVLSALTDVFAQIAAKWLANKVMQQVGAKVSSMAQIMGSAAAAGAAAFASTAAIPIVGPGLAPAAAAAAYEGAASFAAMPGFAVGAWNIPYDAMTKVHKGETILNATDSENFRAARQGGATGGGGDVHMHVHTQSTQDFASFLSQNSHVLAPALRRLGRNISPNKA